MAEKKFKRLTDADKAAIRGAWELGSATMGDMAQQYKVSESTIARTVSGLEKGAKSDIITNRVQEAIVKNAEDEAGKHADRLIDVKEQAFRRQETVQKLIMREIGLAVKDKVPFGSIAPQLKALKMAAEALKIGRQEMYEILGINPNDVDLDDLPELIFKIVGDEEIRTAVEIQAQAMSAEYKPDIKETDSDADELGLEED